MQPFKRSWVPTSPGRGQPRPTWRLGIDIGGTFTDFVFIDTRTGKIHTEKRLTTADDPARSVFEGINTLLEATGATVADISTFVHGTTLAINAVIERKGARTGLLTTMGFSDTIELGRETRYDLYDLKLRFPVPLVGRQLRKEVKERIGPRGDVLTPIDPDDVLEHTRALVEQDRIESLAVCFLHSYLNPEHERAAKQAIARTFPDLPVSISSEVTPSVREYERTSTVVVNAYVQPVVAGYLGRIESWLATRGLRGSFLLMTSSGGTISSATARALPVRLLESGPVAGMQMASLLASLRSDRNVLAFDMGGTTSKGYVVVAGEAEKTYQWEIARVHEFKVGSGLPIQSPAMKLVEIGSGGGSIAAIDRRGVLQVGPRSSGASPGPACYGSGGVAPTITDANVLLGFLGAESFLGGRMRLQTERAAGAIDEALGKPLGLGTLEAAWGIHEMANEDISRAFRIHAAERGIDVGGFTMIAFGGAGPLHAVRVAQKLRMRRVVVPLRAGVFSALGLLTAPIAFDVASTRRTYVSALTTEEIARHFTPLEDVAMQFVLKTGLPRGQVKISRELEVRYFGQGHEVVVKLPRRAGVTPEMIASLFHKAYQRTYQTTIKLDYELEVMNWRVELVGPNPRIELRQEQHESGDPVAKGTRLAHFNGPGRGVRAMVFDRSQLHVGQTVSGPAIVEEVESSLVIPPGHAAVVDPWLNLVIDLDQASGQHGV
ncbi:MAG: hydantoinase/oxoprolinase family protein [Betaproteobacteria bacterium]|nr:hydantoinase/oxoprolinase family protein [Betaproteobacteria bacterium]